MEKGGVVTLLPPDVGTASDYPVLTSQPVRRKIMPIHLPATIAKAQGWLTTSFRDTT